MWFNANESRQVADSRLLALQDYRGPDDMVFVANAILPILEANKDYLQYFDEVLLSIEYPQQRIWQPTQTYGAATTRAWPGTPESSLNREFDYHHMQEHGGQPKTVNDISAGNATFSEKLRAEFDPVVVFVLSPDNAALADPCLGKDIFTQRVDGAEEVDILAEDSADIVFTANLMHYCDQQKAVAAIVEQLGPCG
ncbi:uncharacterized protein E0L32_009421 [Thyridium curvatum]|uniref:Methyltransferase type 11 domain-containing protein n=1 Tax=Thyridium curvatum TaxID=1093900 RepID=A0A507APQ2_9PEZI|nr:uncharacterized protein E0L32_009421 [Thyridium curvatum]TPX09377.1 hypothetical protein E0L32_009421 [Thyridium curvatum]